MITDEMVKAAEREWDAITARSPHVHISTALRAALAAAERARWRPISEAPTDGSRWIVWDATSTQSWIAGYATNRKQWIEHAWLWNDGHAAADAGAAWVERPTHFQPLPSPPESGR